MVTDYFHPRLIVGLGNPGRTYERTYHNVGSLAVDHLAAGLGEEPPRWKKLPAFEYCRTKRYIFVKTRTFMNESGKAVAAALRYFRLGPGSAAVIHDDSDIVLGRYRASFDRGAAGHRGILSVIELLGTKKFARYRIGIRATNPPANRRARAGSFVLNPISSADNERLHSVFASLKEKLTANETPPST